MANERLSGSSKRLEKSVARHGRADESRADWLLFIAVIVDVCLLALAGGPPPNPATTSAILLLSLILTALLTFVAIAPERRPSRRWRGLLIAMVALPVLQLVPLPPAVWRVLPGGDLRFDVLTLVRAQQGWQPLSLVPIETAGAALLAFSFVVFLAAMIALTERRFHHVLITLGLVTLVNAAVGIVQVANGGSPRILVKADHGALLGFFANKNHAGVAIATTLALFVYLTEILPLLRAHRRLWLMAATLAALVCAVSTNSRAGLLLTLGTGLWLTIRFVAKGQPWIRGAVIAGGVAITALFSLSPVLDKVFHRFDNVDQDLRWRFIQQSEPLMHTYGLLGAGGGSFRRIFIVNERLQWVKPTIVNEVHNEYLQTTIEYGVPGTALLLLALATFVWSGGSSWRGARPGSATRFRLEVGGVIVLLFMLHSAVDYPLRRPACWALFAAGYALVARAGRTSARGERLPVRNEASSS